MTSTTTELPPLQRELERRRGNGFTPVTVREMKERLAALGYKMDRGGDCMCNPRYVVGPNAGESYPAITTVVREIDSGLSFANENARRDARFDTLQRMRFEGSLFAVVRGRLLEI